MSTSTSAKWTSLPVEFCFGGPEARRRESIRYPRKAKVEGSLAEFRRKFAEAEGPRSPRPRPCGADPKVIAAVKGYLDEWKRGRAADLGPGDEDSED